MTSPRPVSPVPSERLHFHRSSPELASFTGELSDLGPGFDLGRLYDDACDVGFTIVSGISGHKMVFVLAREERDAEGDLLALHFTPVARFNRDDVLTGYVRDDEPVLTAVLYND